MNLKSAFYSFWAEWTGFNLEGMPTALIVDQLNEPRPLPMGREEFEEWSDRLISGALIPGGESDPVVFHESQKFALANMLMHLGPTESHKPDAFFIHSLRKFAINQVADSVRKELHDAAKARTAALEKTEDQKTAEVTAEETLKRAEALKAV